MADITLASASQWQQVRREHRVARFAPVITLRKNGSLALSADFVRMADIEGRSRVSLFLSADGLRLALNFHDDERDDNAFLVVTDGGGGKANRSRNKIVNAQTLMRTPLIAKLSGQDRHVRRLEPRKDNTGRWVVNIAPCFERSLDAAGEFPTGASGIYRYLLGHEVRYIGRGILADRFSSPERKRWDYDKIEYSILNDDVIERRWEAFWLEDHRSRFSRLPVYNSIGGSAPEAQTTG